MLGIKSFSSHTGLDESVNSDMSASRYGTGDDVLVLNDEYDGVTEVEGQLKREFKNEDRRRTHDFVSASVGAKTRSERREIYPSVSYLKRLKYLSDANSFVAFFRVLLFLLCMLLLCFPVTAILLVLVTSCWIFKEFYGFCAKLWHGRAFRCVSVEAMSHQEKQWLIDDSQNIHVVQAIIFVENGLDFFQIRNLIASRVVYAEHRNGERCYPRFTHKIVKLPVGFAWTQDDAFMLERHVVPMPSTAVCLESLRAYVTKMAVCPIDFNYPLWQIQVLDNFGADKETVIVFRMHPCFANGISLSRLLADSFSDQKTVTTMWQYYSPYIYAINSFRALFLTPIVFLQKWIFTKRDYNFIHDRPASSFKVSSQSELTLAWSDDFPLSSANRIKSVARSTLNDILLAVSTSVLRRHLISNGTLNPKDFKVLLPVEMNSHDIDINFCLRYTYVDFELPVNTEGNIPRLWETKNRVEAFKNSADAVVLRLISWISDKILPYSLWQKLHRCYFNKFSAVVTNIPGPDTELFVCSKLINRVLYSSPPFHDILVSLSFFTYNNSLNLSVTAHKSVLSNPHQLTQDFIDEMNVLFKMLQNRRLPGEHSHRTDCPYRPFLNTDNITVTQVEERLCEVQKQMLEIRQSLQGMEGGSEGETTALNNIESLKCEFRQLLAELRKIRFAKKAVYPSDEDEEEVICNQDARRRSARLSLASLHSSSGHLSGTRSVDVDEAERAARGSVCVAHDSAILLSECHERDSLVRLAQIHPPPSGSLHESTLPSQEEHLYEMLKQ